MSLPSYLKLSSWLTAMPFMGQASANGAPRTSWKPLNIDPRLWRGSLNEGAWDEAAFTRERPSRRRSRRLPVPWGSRTLVLRRARAAAAYCLERQSVAKAHHVRGSFSKRQRGTLPANSSRRWRKRPSDQVHGEGIGGWGAVWRAVAPCTAWNAKALQKCANYVEENPQFANFYKALVLELRHVGQALARSASGGPRDGVASLRDGVAPADARCGEGCSR
jgi:hypothetical protein